MEIAFASSSHAKFGLLDLLINSNSDENGFTIVPFAGLQVPDEGSNPKTNSILKSRIASREIESLVLASDEELLFPTPLSHLAPKALISRVNGKKMSETELFFYYNDLLLKNDLKEIDAEVWNHLALSRLGKYIRHVKIRFPLKIRISKQKKWIPGRPLSGLHFVSRFNKYYWELVEEEILSLYEVQANKIVSFCKQTLSEQEVSKPQLIISS